jgi:hypothetical protein
MKKNLSVTLLLLAIVCMITSCGPAIPSEGTEDVTPKEEVSVLDTPTEKETESDTDTEAATDTPAVDLSAILSKAPPMMVYEPNETLVSCEAQVISLQHDICEYTDFILRWGLFQKANNYRYGFDILSAEDGSLVATAPYDPLLYRYHDAGGMIYFDDPLTTDRGAMIFMYEYGLDNNGNIVYNTLSYRIKYQDDGTFIVDTHFHLKPGLTASGTVNKMIRRELNTEIFVLTMLYNDLADDRTGTKGNYLMSTSPDGNTTVFTAQNSPAFDLNTLKTVMVLKVTDIVELGIPGFYEQYAPRKKE